jgi:NDP-sugar pyrophosphorylase family protein
LTDVGHIIIAEFSELIDQERLHSFNKHSSSIYGLYKNYNIVYLNDAWFNFAQENSNNNVNTTEYLLGRNIFDTIPDVQKSFYKNLFDSILNANCSPLVLSRTEYECSGPTLYRPYAMHIYPIGTEGLVVIHSLVVNKDQKQNTEALDKYAFELQMSFHTFDLTIEQKIISKVLLMQC